MLKEVIVRIKDKKSILFTLKKTSYNESNI